MALMSFTVNVRSQISIKESIHLCLYMCISFPVLSVCLFLTVCLCFSPSVSVELLCKTVDIIRCDSSHDMVQKLNLIHLSA